MLAEGTSPPPADAEPHSSNPATPLPSQTSGNGHPVITVPAVARKRKRAPATSSSPAPSDLGSTAGNGTDLLPTSRADLSSRPILSISRGPIFVPISEGSEWFKTDMVGINRIGYRYIPAGINPPGYATPCRTIESNPTSFRVSWEDRSPFLKVSKDGLSIAGSKGFRSARCNAPIREGKWYLEVKILRGGGEHIGDETQREGSHVRIGWGRREAPLNAPVGLDGYSYGYRDKTGDKVTLSRPRPYGRPFTTGDVVGMYISLPPRRQPNPKDPHDPAHMKRERIPIDLKGQEVFEILEYPQSKEMTSLMDYSGKSTTSASLPSSKKPNLGKLPERGAGPAPTNKAPSSPSLRPLPVLAGSRIAFFVNGECQGTAFSDIYDYLPLRQSETHRKAKERKRTREGVKEHRENPFDDGTLGYYPFISLFNDASVRLNPGPDFDYPPPPDIDAVLDGGSKGCESNPSPMGVDQNTAIMKVDESEPHVNQAKTETEDQQQKETISLSLPSPSQTSQRTWRPTIERYPEFMAEEWALDDLDEAQAKAEAQKAAAASKIEEDKRKSREKKRQQAEAKRKAKKKAAAEQAANLALGVGSAGAGYGGEDDRFGPGAYLAVSGSNTPIGNGSAPGSIYNHPSPSPLRQTTTAFEDECEVPEYGHSPAPTFTSCGGDFQGNQSGYNSEAHDEMDIDQELEGLLPDPRARTPA